MVASFLALVVALFLVLLVVTLLVVASFLVLVVVVFVVVVVLLVVVVAVASFVALLQATRATPVIHDGNDVYSSDVSFVAYTPELGCLFLYHSLDRFVRCVAVPFPYCLKGDIFFIPKALYRVASKTFVLTALTTQTYIPVFLFLSSTQNTYRKRWNSGA